MVFNKKKNGERTAVFTFINKLEKGKETIQIQYLVEEQMIERIIVNKKWNNLAGKLDGTLYCLLREKNNYEGSLISKGEVTIENGKGSGTAQFVAENQFDKNQFDQKYHYLEITGLNFKNVGYSDLDETKRKLDALSSLN